MKADGRLSRSSLKSAFGDAIFAVLCGCGHNIRKNLAHLRASFAWITIAILTTINVTRRDLQMLRAA
jgi:IS5 family transposase